MQSVLLKAVIPMVPIVEKLVEEKDKVPNDVLNVPGFKSGQPQMPLL